MSKTLRCLAIGIPSASFAEPTIRPDEAASITFAGLAQLLPLPATLELVVAPLFCNDFDALEIIEALGSAGYRGILRIVTSKLPNRQIVLRELRSHAVRQGLTLELAEQP